MLYKCSWFQTRLESVPIRFRSPRSITLCLFGGLHHLFHQLIRWFDPIAHDAKLCLRLLKRIIQLRKVKGQSIHLSPLWILYSAAIAATAAITAQSCCSFLCCHCCCSNIKWFFPFSVATKIPSSVVECLHCPHPLFFRDGIGAAPFPPLARARHGHSNCHSNCHWHGHLHGRWHGR